MRLFWRNVRANNDNQTRSNASVNTPNRHFTLYKRILVVRLKEIGDTLLSLPVCSSLKRTYPYARIDYMLYQHIVPLLSGHPDIDNIVSVSPSARGNPFEYWRIIKSLRDTRYDLAIDLITTPQSAVITRLCGAAETIGFGHKKNRSFLYQIRVPHPATGGTVRAKLSILKALGQEVRYQEEFRLYLRPDEIDKMKDRLVKHGLDLSRPVFLCAPASRLREKVWPEEYMAEVMEHCRDTHGAQIVLNWIPGPEREVVDRLIPCLRNAQHVYPDFPCDLRELAVLIHLSDFALGNDGSPMHIAVAVGTPSFVVFSPINQKQGWLSGSSARHQGIDIKDAMSLDDAEYGKLTGEIRDNVQKFYKKITPGLVIERLDNMLIGLNTKC